MNFKVGDVCVLVEGTKHDKTGTSTAGLECVVVGPLEAQWFGATDTYRMAHDIEVEGYGLLIAEPHELRLKRPPTWDKWIFNTAPVRNERIAEVAPA